MKTYLDIVRETEYRKCVEERLDGIAENLNYHFPTKFPPLYRYRSLSSYAVDDIIRCQETATSIGEFNDLFDGAIHRYGSTEEQLKAAEEKWNEIESDLKAANLPENTLSRDNYIASYQEYFKEESRLRFDLLNYLGTYVCCFSELQTSTLMWSHYADSNKGICIAYDFNQWDADALQRYLLFPVAYSKQPVRLDELLEDKQNKICQYPLDTAVLCAALNKALIWQYEREWRMIWVTATNRVLPQRLPLLLKLKPTSICFGYHFLKPFFYYNFENTAERENCKKNIDNCTRLIEYMIEQKIPAEIMWPNIGSYNLSAKRIEPNRLLRFLKHHFKYGPARVRFYRVYHDDLHDCIEECMENSF